MPLPENFNEWEFLQDMVRLWHNKAVDKWFKNQEPNSISTPKERLRHACTMKDGDTSTMAMMRLWLFEVTAGHSQSLQPPIYGVPVQELQRDVTFRPQIKLVFKEQRSPESGDRTSLSVAEITIRLMNETSSTINRTKAEALALEIKNEFATPPFVWEKGWYKATYLDKERGYDLRLLVKSKAEGVRVIQQVLKIQDHVYDDDCLQFIDHERSYPLDQGTHLVYGRTIKKPVKRPRVDVVFRYAQLLVNGRANAINLVAIAGTGLRSVIQTV